jgi:hypothetical protein
MSLQGSWHHTGRVKQEEKAAEMGKKSPLGVLEEGVYKSGWNLVSKDKQEWEKLSQSGKTWSQSRTWK